MLVSGGAGGIGASIVEAFTHQRARVIFLDRDASAAYVLTQRLFATYGIAPVFHECDLSQIDLALPGIDALLAGEPAIDVLVNNAGNDEAHTLASVTPAYFDDRVSVNLKHQFFLAQRVAPKMVAQGAGSIINVGSISWMIGAPSVPVYATAKAGVEGLTRSLARELGRSGIRVNSLAPGWVLTERQLAKGEKDPTKFADYLNRQAIKEHLQPSDVAELVLWLSADESRLCTGHTWFVDGGAC